MSIPTELAWAAGFFDGEECATYSYSGPKTRRRKTYLKLTVSQTDPDPIERFAKAVGIGTVNGPYPPRGPYSLKETWVWQASGAKAQIAFDLLRPYLSKPKLNQITATLAVATQHNETREEV